MTFELSKLSVSSPKRINQEHFQVALLLCGKRIKVSSYLPKWQVTTVSCFYNVSQTISCISVEESNHVQSSMIKMQIQTITITITILV